MFNDHLSNEEAKERIKQRIKEAKSYSLQKRLGYGDSGITRWIFILMVVIVVVTIGLLM
jgi:hypothetical protein